MEKLNTIYELSLSVFGITTGPILGVFLAGMLSRRANTKVRKYFLFTINSQLITIVIVRALFVELLLLYC